MSVMSTSCNTWVQPPGCLPDVDDIIFSSAPPACPAQGQLWWDGTMLHLFGGAAWADIGPTVGGGAFVGTSPPQNPASGTLWWNGVGMQLWNGAFWVSATPLPFTDGSLAAPGQLGELITYTFAQQFAVSASNQTFPIPGITVSAGDWDIWAWGSCSVYVQSVEFYSTTVPSGMSGTLEAYDSALLNGGTGTVQVSARVVSPTVRGSFSAVTTLPVTLLVLQTVGSGGTFTFNAAARRVR